MCTSVSLMTWHDMLWYWFHSLATCQVATARSRWRYHTVKHNMCKIDCHASPNAFLEFDLRLKFNVYKSGLIVNFLIWLYTCVMLKHLDDRTLPQFWHWGHSLVANHYFCYGIWLTCSLAILGRYFRMGTRTLMESKEHVHQQGCDEFIQSDLVLTSWNDRVVYVC